MTDAVDPVPVRCLSHRRCQGRRCDEVAFWNRWGGYYCYGHAIRAGWLPGPVQRRGDQMVLA